MPTAAVEILCVHLYIPPFPSSRLRDDFLQSPYLPHPQSKTMQWQVKRDQGHLAPTAMSVTSKRRWRLPRVQLSVRSHNRQQHKQRTVSSLRSQIALPATRVSSSTLLLRPSGQQQQARMYSLGAKPFLQETKQSGRCARFSWFSFFRTSRPCLRVKYRALDEQQAWNQAQLESFLSLGMPARDMPDKWRVTSLHLRLSQDIWIEVEPLGSKARGEMLTHKASVGSLIREEMRFSPLL